MRLPHLLFVLALAIAATLGWILFGIDPVNDAAGLPHPVHRPMFQGGPGLERMQPLLLPAWLLGSLGVAFFATCFALGARRHDRRTVFLITSAALVYEAVWTTLVVLQWRFATALPESLYLGFPASTAWLFFVFTPAPLIFLAIYLYCFDSFMPPDSAIEKLRAMREERETREHE
ncbi:MAG: hypothetical protein JRG86_19755 [Deltaproteobacteria bacterium]|jgi:hypothetical protein|nr:hypothetical protein [Deltaproteobacteria bacterium]